MANKMEIGVVGVDSGQLMICDPCYIGSQKSLSDYERICDLTLSPRGYGQINYDMGHDGAGVVFGTLYGDGVYPVIGTFEDGKLVKIEVELD